MSKIKTGGLDQHDAEPFEQQQFGTAGIERVNVVPHGVADIDMSTCFHDGFSHLITCISFTDQLWFFICEMGPVR